MSRNGRTHDGEAVWAAECAGLLPFVSETGATPRAAVIRFLRRVANHYERHEHEPLPEIAVRIMPSRRRVAQIAANSAEPLPWMDWLEERPLIETYNRKRPVEIVITRRRVGSLSDERRKTYRYTERRWAALTAAFERAYGDGHPRRDDGRWGFYNEGDEEE